MANNVMFISDTKIKAISTIQVNVEKKILDRSILDVQAIYLRPILGDGLYKNLINYVIGRNIPASNGGVIGSDGNAIVASGDAIAVTATIDKNEQYDDLINEYIQPYLANAVLLDLIVNLQFRVSNKGLIKISDNNTSVLSGQDTEDYKASINVRAMSYKSQLVNYLDTNSITVDSCKKGRDRDTITDVIGWYLD